MRDFSGSNGAEFLSRKPKFPGQQVSTKVPKTFPGRQGSTQLALRSGMELMACRLADQNARRIPPGPANRAASAPDFDAFRMFLESGETHQELPWKTQWHCLNLRTRLGTTPSAALFQIRLRPCLWRFVRRSAKTDGLWPNQPARLHLRGVDDSCREGRISNISRRGMQLVTAEPVAGSGRARIAWDGRGEPGQRCAGTGGGLTRSLARNPSGGPIESYLPDM